MADWPVADNSDVTLLSSTGPQANDVLNVDFDLTILAIAAADYSGTAAFTFATP